MGFELKPVWGLIELFISIACIVTDVWLMVQMFRMNTVWGDYVISAYTLYYAPIMHSAVSGFFLLISTACFIAWIVKVMKSSDGMCAIMLSAAFYIIYLIGAIFAVGFMFGKTTKAGMEDLREEAMERYKVCKNATIQSEFTVEVQKSYRRHRRHRRHGSSSSGGGINHQIPCDKLSSEQMEFLRSPDGRLNLCRSRRPLGVVLAVISFVLAIPNVVLMNLIACFLPTESPNHCGDQLGV